MRFLAVLLSRFPLLSVWTLLPVYAIAFVLLVLIVRKPGKGATWWRWVVGAGMLGAVVGLVLAWFIGDVLDALDVSPTTVDRFWAAAVFAGFGVALVAVILGSWRRRVIAGAGVVVFVLAGCLAINRDGGLFPTLGSVVGLSTVAPLKLPPQAASSSSEAVTYTPDLFSSWTPPASMPTKGRFGSVEIPGTSSGFAARPGIVYLPPAALVPGAPALPVVIMMSGQGPGAAPANVLEAGHLDTMMDALAAKNHGLAPIVVIPDQLERATNNPMCVDGRLGNSLTYLTVDVPNWVRDHLHVQTGARAWAVGGFSQGGTCAVQLGAGRPDLFGSFLDISGQLGPILSSRSESIEQGFAGNARAYDDAQPAAVMKKKAPYADSAAYFYVGADDTRYDPATITLSAAATNAGMKVQRNLLPGSGHDWTTASVGLEQGMGHLESRLGLRDPVLSH
jgi:enterochelin esterase-like enzyme